MSSPSEACVSRKATAAAKKGINQISRVRGGRVRKAVPKQPSQRTPHYPEKPSQWTQYQYQQVHGYQPQEMHAEGDRGEKAKKKSEMRQAEGSKAAKIAALPAAVSENTSSSQPEPEQQRSKLRTSVAASLGGLKHNPEEARKSSTPEVEVQALADPFSIRVEEKRISTSSATIKRGFVTEGTYKNIADDFEMTDRRDVDNNAGGGDGDGADAGMVDIDSNMSSASTNPPSVLAFAAALTRMVTASNAATFYCRALAVDVQSEGVGAGAKVTPDGGLVEAAA
ncbi:hypothetical protein LTR85_005603 [Meristemomyces frigidus]|nr:hypothetical protein LTR85_005603 [Meristemomyces frigidus]